MKKLAFVLAALVAAGGSARATNYLGYVPSTITSGQVPSATNGTGGLGASSITDSGGGVQIGSPTGGAEGAGTVNATGLYINGTAVGSPVIRDYFSGLVLSNDASTTTMLDITAGEAADSTNTVMMTSASPCTVDLAVSGIGGLDTGSAATSTWYGYFLVNGTSGTGCIASAAAPGSIAGNGTSTGGSTTAGSATLTLSTSETLKAGTVVYIEGAGPTNGTNHAGFTSRILTTATGTSFTMRDKAPATSAFANVAWSTFASGDGPTLPGGYTYYRLVGVMETQSGTAAPILFVQQNSTVQLVTPIEDLSAVIVGNSTGSLQTLSIPRGLMVYPIARIATGGSGALACQSPLEPSLAPGLTRHISRIGLRRSIWGIGCGGMFPDPNERIGAGTPHDERHLNRSHRIHDGLAIHRGEDTAMIRAFLIAAAILLAAATDARAYPVWCALTANVVTGGCVANDPSNSAFTEMDSSDARITAWNTTSPQAMAQQANAAIGAGTIAITSTGTPALNGTYPVNTIFMIALHQEELCLLATSTEFCNLQTTRTIPDITGAMHTFNKTQFNNFLLAIGGYLDSLIVVQLQLSNGVSATLPAASATIP